jgi:DNA processing protein
VTLFDDDYENIENADLRTVSGLAYLMAVPGIGAARALKIATVFGSLEKLRNTSLTELSSKIGKLASVLMEYRQYEITPISLPDGIRAMCYFDDDFPSWAKNLRRDIPAILYIRGTLPTIPLIAVVGTRNPTSFGRRAVQLLGPLVAERQWGIVSGLALGIDTISHLTALENGVPTWAILGSGVDVPSPNSNRELADEIVAKGGGLISEQPLGTSPQPQTLVARNRLQVASAQIVFAAQSGIPSGTLHTVRFAIEQDKRLVVPRPRDELLMEVQSAGNVALTDPNGCEPSIIGATGQLARKIRERHPVADLVVGSQSLDLIWN